jgi:hypothetical protein
MLMHCCPSITGASWLKYTLLVYQKDYLCEHNTLPKAIFQTSYWALTGRRRRIDCKFLAAGAASLLGWGAPLFRYYVLEATRLFLATTGLLPLDRTPKI